VTRQEARLRLENERLRRALANVLAMTRGPRDVVEMSRIREACEILDGASDPYRIAKRPPDLAHG
jgi:hypothetical protein